MDSDNLPPRILRRLLKEISRNNLNAEIIDGKYIYLPIKLYPSLQKKAIENGIDPALIITLKNYPWRAPKVCFCSISTNCIYKCGGEKKYTDELEKIMGENICLGCTSILCGNTWTPNHGINDIVTEFKKFTTLKARIIERIICNQIQEKMFLKISGKQTLPLDHYRISDFL